MKKRERLALLQAYGPLYKRHFSNEPGCFYCGGDASEEDHVPPITWAGACTSDGWRKRGVTFWRLRCCSPCNALLGGRPLFTPDERLAYLERELSKAYERAAALWSEDEIAEMGERFQKTLRARKRAILSEHARIRFVQWRLAHPETHPETHP